MIQFELHTPSIEPGAEWVVAARLRVADDGSYELFDPVGVLDLQAVHGTPRRSDGVRFADDPEEWARAAVATFNAPDLVPANLIDTDPWEAPEFEDLSPDFGSPEHHVAAGQALAAS